MAPLERENQELNCTKLPKTYVYISGVPRGIRWPLEGGDSRKRKRLSPIDTTSVKDVPDAHGMPTERGIEPHLFARPAPAAISPVDT